VSRKGRRGLTPDEQDLWGRVTRKTTPLHPDRHQSIGSIGEEVPGNKPTRPAPDPVPTFRVGQNSSDTMLSRNLPPGLSRSLNELPVRMDRRAHAQLKRGKLKPESRIDLHGMTLARAHPELNQFILEAHAKGRRLVLVITGKGKDRDDGGPIPVRRGVLKHQVPVWLQTPPLSHVILQVSEAHLKHGGTGAYYVYLRRNR